MTAVALGTLGSVVGVAGALGVVAVPGLGPQRHGILAEQQLTRDLTITVDTVVVVPGAPTTVVDPTTAAASPSPATPAPQAPATTAPRVTVPPATAAPTTHAPAPASTAAPTTAPHAAGTTLPPDARIPADWPADKPIPPIPPGCREPVLEDNGVWNCDH